MQWTFVWVILAAFAAVPRSQGQPTFTRLVGPPTCTVNVIDRTLTTTFVSRLNSDQINLVKSCRFNETTNAYQYEDCTGDFFEQGGVRYLTVTSTVNIDDPSDGLATNPCGFTPTELEPGKWKYKWILALRRYEDFLMYGDLNYAWECVPSSAVDTYLSTSLAVTFDDLVQNVQVINPLITFTAVQEDGSPVTSCAVGENLKFRLSMTNSLQYQDFLTYYGLFSYVLRVARTLDDLVGLVDTSLLTGDDGCVIQGNLLSLESGLVYETDDSTSQTAVYLSGTFKCKRYFNSDQLWFGTIISFCAGIRDIALTNINDRCYSYCDFNSQRRRRSVANDTEVEHKPIYISLTVKDAEDEESPEKSEGLSQTALIAIVASVSVLVLALIVAFVVFLCYMSRSPGDKRSRSYSDSSLASSDRKLPLRF